MKKFVLIALVAILSLVGQTAQAQYQRGDLTGNLGLSLVPYGYGLGYAGDGFGFLPLTTNLEYSLDDRFAVGGYLGFYSRYSSFSFGARGTFHATSTLNDWFNWNIDDSRWDIYASAILGLEMYNRVDYRYDNSNPWSPTMTPYSRRASRLDIGPLVGGRYFINPSFAVFAESGTGTMGAFTIGATLKF